MFAKRFKIMTLLGFPIYIDISWFIIVVLITWSWAWAFRESPLFRVDGISVTAATILGAIGALGLFVSVLLHELGHAVIARRHGVEMRGITLFIFGGVAEMVEEPPNAMAETLVAVAGPIVSVVLSIVFLVTWLGGALLGFAEPIVKTAMILWFVNTAIVVFNLIPAFPLDGGRILRGLLWHWKDNLRWATRITSTIGGAFGLVLIAFAILNLFGGNIIGAIWFGLLGLFLRNAAQMSYQQLLVRRALEGEPVRRFMKDQPVTVTPDTTVGDLVEHYIYEHHYKMYPVAQSDALHGLVTFQQVREVPREQWEQVTVREIMSPVSEDNSIHADDDATRAMSKMRNTNLSRLLVVENGRLVGIIALKDLMEFLSLRIDLEEE